MGTSLATIKLLYNYNRWANLRVLAVCESLTLEQWARELGHSWGSVHGLLTHMYAAEAIWVSRWKGDSPRVMAKAADFPTYAALERAWMQVENDILNFIDTCNDKTLSEEVTYINTRGVTYTFPLGQLMLHLANHQTHHRGELAAMLAILDVPHPEDDLLLYMREMANDS